MEKKVIIIGVPSKHYTVVIDSLANKVHQNSDYSKTYAYFHIHTNFLIDHFISGNIRKYKMGDVKDDDFIEFIDSSLPTNHSLSHEDIKDSWNLMSTPDETKVNKICFLTGTENILAFVSFTNSLHIENFFSVLEKNCESFKRNDHIHAFSYLSEQKNTDKKELILEAFRENNVTYNDNITSLQSDVQSLLGYSVTYIEVPDLTY